MKEINIKNKKYNLPENWNEITEAQRVAIEQLVQEGAGGETFKIAAILLGCNDEDLRDMDFFDAMMLNADIRDLMRQKERSGNSSNLNA